MVKNSFFSRGNLAKMVIIFFGMSYFFNVLPAALEPVHAAIQSKTVQIIAGPDFTGTHSYTFLFRPSFDDNFVTDPAVIDAYTRKIAVNLPRETILIAVVKSETGKSVFQQKFWSEEIERLDSLTINELGSVEAQYRESKPRGRAIAEISIPVTIAVDRDTPLNIYFRDSHGHYVQEEIMTRQYARNAIIKIHLPVKKISIKVVSVGNSMENEKVFTAGEIARLKSLKVDGSILKHEFLDQSSVSAPTAEVKPAVVPAMPVFSRYHEIIEKGDAKSLYAIMPELTKLQVLDGPDSQGILALSKAVMLYKNALDMINALVANGASCFIKDPTGKQPLDYAGEQRANLLKSIEITAECPICFDSKQLMMLSCLHGMCRECLTKLMERPVAQRLCPTCRNPIPLLEGIRCLASNRL